MGAKTARILPAKTGTPDAFGTCVMVGEEEIRVSSLTLKADAKNGKWEATITCEVIVDGEIVAEVVNGS